MIDHSSNETYRVEVSGWDGSGNFFVEKTILRWSPDSGKEVSVRSALREGDILFVRLNQTWTATPTFPIAYRAEKVSPRDSSGFIRLSLVQLRPRSFAEADQFASQPKSGHATIQRSDGFRPIDTCKEA